MYNWIYLATIIIIAALPQIGLFLWWGSNLSTRIRQLEAENGRLRTEVDGINIVRTEIAVIKNTLATQTSMLEDIKQSLRGK